MNVLVVGREVRQLFFCYNESESMETEIGDRVGLNLIKPSKEISSSNKASKSGESQDGW